MTEPIARTWRPGRPVPLGAILGIYRHGANDPAYQRDPDGTIWRVSRTPAGPVTIEMRASAGAVESRAWGPGAGWAVESVPSLLGDGDDPSGFEPRHEVLRQAYRRFGSWRVPASGLVLESLVPAV